MGLVEGKRILITGVLTEDSIAFAVARRVQAEGADIVLTGAGRGLSLTMRTARRLPGSPPVLELDVTDTGHLEGLAGSLADLGWESVDGALHAIGFAPKACLGQEGGVLVAGWDEVGTALHVSSYSLKALAVALLPLMGQGGSLVGLDFDASQAWPAYDWMGVAKAALEAANRYLARDLGGRGIRVNLVSAGPIRTVAGRSIPGFDRFEELWSSRSPMGWDVDDAEPVAQACTALFSDWFPATTGEIVHVDGGFHAVGA